jgi:large subunit ribosomal protein L25
MADVVTLAASPRQRAGKGSARAARRAGQVPAVVYGNKLEVLSIAIERKQLERELHQPGFFIRLMEITLDGESHRVLPRDVQYHPVTDAPLHVDFLRFSADRKITVAVPMQFTNEAESPGLKRGGTLNIVRHRVEVLCTADNIPQTFVIDLSGFDIGDAVHASQLSLPEGVTFTITDRDFTIATVAAPTVVAEETTEGEEAEAIEGEEAVEGGEAAGESTDED